MTSQQIREKSVLKFVWHYLRQHKLAQFGFFVVAVSWAAEVTITPYWLKRIIDVSTQYHGQDLIVHILWPCAIYASMSAWMNLNFRLFDYINLKLYPIIKANIAQDMFDYLMPHSYKFFQNNFSGSLTRKIFDMSTNVEHIIQIFNIWFYPRLIALVIASISMALVVKPIFGTILLAWTLTYTAISSLGAKWTEKHAHKLSEARTHTNGTIADSVSNIILTKIFSNMSHESQRVGQSLKQLISLDRKVGWTQLFINFLQGMMVTVLNVTMLFLLVDESKTGAINAGDFAFILTLSMFISGYIWELGTQMLEFSKAIGECRQAMSYLTEPHAVSDMADAKPLSISEGKIEFNHVTFFHEENAPLFKDLNITIPAGQSVGLVGASGGGKSSFIKLILRLMDVQQGNILIDGQNTKHVQKDSLRRQITCIPQETELFHRSIIDNIRFGRIDASDEEVIEAAKNAHCHTFISELPDGYASLVGERGVKLSGGQKQRIAIARAFLKNSPVLVLDEATSALDSVTEKNIQTGLQELMAGKTTIAIAHRLSTLKNMDRILVFDQGNIIQDGSLEALLSDKEGPFYALWKMQSKGFLGE